MRTLVIGDIHGGLKALVQILIRCGYDPEYDQLIFIGDYVDGWSESSELIEFLLEIEAQAKYKPIFLRGNHDKWCEDWLISGQIHPYWLPQGGQATLDSYIRTGYLTEDKHRDFFRKLKNYYIDDQNRGFVHGGFVSRKGLGYDPHESDYYWDRDMWQLAVLLHGKEAQVEGNEKAIRFRKHKEVFIGHTSTTSWKCKTHYPEYSNPKQPSKSGSIMVPMNRCNVWNMDTGGGWGGKLTIMDIDTKEFWQSDLLQYLYPDELGRG